MAKQLYAKKKKSFIPLILLLIPSLSYSFTEVEPGGEPPIQYVPIAVDDITIFVPTPSKWLPPDPGSTGKSTIEGVDSDNDGVRDDIERYIAYKYPNEAELRGFLYQYARAKQALLINRTDKTTTINNYKVLINWIGCILKNTDDSKSMEIINGIEAAYINTLDRIDAYKISGTQLNNVRFRAVEPSCAQ